MKKVVSIVMAMLFSASLFAEVSYRFYNKVSSDTLNIRHVDDKYTYGTDAANSLNATKFNNYSKYSRYYGLVPDLGYSDGESHTDADFLGVTNRVYAEIKTDKTDAMVKATFGFNDWTDNDDYGFKWTGYVDDWYVEYRPFHCFTFGFHDGIYMQGSYLPIYDDNLYSGNIGSEGVTVVYRPSVLKDALRIAVTTPFTTKTNWLYADSDDDDNVYYVDSDGNVDSKTWSSREPNIWTRDNNGDLKYWNNSVFNSNLFVSDYTEYKTNEFIYEKTGNFTSAVDDDTFNVGIGAIYGVKYFEAGVSIQDIFDSDERRFGTYVNFPELFGAVKGLTIGGGFAYSKDYSVHNYDDDNTFSDYTYFGGVNGKELFSTYATYDGGNFNIKAEAVYNGGETYRTVTGYRYSATKGFYSSAAYYDYGWDLYTAASFQWWIAKKFSATAIAKILVDTAESKRTEPNELGWPVTVNYGLKNVYAGEFKINYQVNQHNELEVSVKTDYYDKNYRICFPVFWKYTF